MSSDDRTPLGLGAFAKILRVVERSSGQAFAMKVMNRPNFAMRGIGHQIEAEISAMRRSAEAGLCRHVVHLFEHIEEGDQVFLRIELCTCDLLRYANQQPGSRIREAEARVWGRQLCLGLRDLHSLGVIHRDVKPDNLLRAVDGTLKIADFGWCADLRDAPASLAGTFQYMAPEILGREGVQTEAVDVWSSGVSLLQLLTGRHVLKTYLGPGSTGVSATDPNRATSLKTGWLIAEIREKCPPAESVRPEFLSHCCWAILRWLLVPDAASRCSVAEALEHPWLQDANGAVVDGLEEGLRDLEQPGCNLASPVLHVPTPARSRVQVTSPVAPDGEEAPEVPEPTSARHCSPPSSAVRRLRSGPAPVPGGSLSVQAASPLGAVEPTLDGRAGLRALPVGTARRDKELRSIAEAAFAEAGAVSAPLGRSVTARQARREVSPSLGSLGKSTTVVFTLTGGGSAVLPIGGRSPDAPGSTPATPAPPAPSPPTHAGYSGPSLVAQVASQKQLSTPVQRLSPRPYTSPMATRGALALPVPPALPGAVPAVAVPWRPPQSRPGGVAEPWGPASPMLRSVVLKCRPA